MKSYWCPRYKAPRLFQAKEAELAEQEPDEKSAFEPDNAEEIPNQVWTLLLSVTTRRVFIYKIYTRYLLVVQM